MTTLLESENYCKEHIAERLPPAKRWDDTARLDALRSMAGYFQI